MHLFTYLLRRQLWAGCLLRLLTAAGITPHLAGTHTAAQATTRAADSGGIVLRGADVGA